MVCTCHPGSVSDQESDKGDTTEFASPTGRARAGNRQPVCILTLVQNEFKRTLFYDQARKEANTTYTARPQHAKRRASECTTTTRPIRQPSTHQTQPTETSLRYMKLATYPKPQHELMGGCATCRHWKCWHETTPRLVAECQRDKPRRDFNHMPKDGCVFWRREVGTEL
jgi:hypothetical protein